MIYHLLLCLGDSLTTGARDTEGRSYPLELARELSSRTREDWYCITEAVNGRTSSELARDAYKIASGYSDVYGVLLLIGTNDSRHGVPPDTFEDNVRQIVRVCRILGKKVYVLSIPAFTPERHFLWYSAEARRLLDVYNERLAKLPGIELIDLRSAVGDADLNDGVHISHEGNLRIARYVAERLLSPGAATVAQPLAGSAPVLEAAQ
jgi:lysophospholipase L1-like esterase